MQNWIEISSEQARRHHLYGFGGWLLLVYALLLLGLLQDLLSYIEIEPFKQWFEDADRAHFFVEAVHLLSWLPFLILTPIRHPLMPKASIVAYWGGMVLMFILVLATEETEGEDLIISAVFAAALGLIFTLYLLRSRRVNVTYRHRVAEDEVPVVDP